MQPECSETPPPGLLKGIEEFNRGEFYECHDTLEELWMAEAGSIRYLYQGILQIGVAFYHLARRRYRPVLTLLRSGSNYLQPFSPTCQGVRLDLLLRDAAQCRAAAEELGPDRLNDFDWTLVPTIRVLDPTPKEDHRNEQRHT